jgi:membrane fusion protein (multidrug efflux system)
LERGRSGRVLGTLVSVAAIVAALAAVVAVAAWPKPKVEVPPVQVAPVNVRVTTIQPIPRLPDSFTLPGTAEPNTVVRVAAEVPGRIETVFLAEGRPVRAGDRLLALNTDLPAAEFSQAKASMEFDAREVARITGLIKQGAASGTELDVIRTRSAASKAGFDAAKARLDRSAISAPISGILNRVPVKAGEYVQPGTNVAEIVQIDMVKITVGVPEQDIQYVKTGQDATVFIDARGGKAVAGKVTYVSELADPRSRTTPVEVTVANPDGAVRSGQLVSVEFVRRIQNDAILIPLAAVIPLENGKRVYLVQDGLAQPREVTLGRFRTREDTIHVEVLSGLKAGDALITDNPRLVGPGQAVKVINGAMTKPATQPGPERTASPVAGELPIAYCPLPIAYCPLPIAYCPLPIAHCQLPIAHCPLPIAYCPLPIAHCLLPIANCRLPIANCPLPIAHCLLPIAHCPFQIGKHSAIGNWQSAIGNSARGCLHDPL